MPGHFLPAEQTVRSQWRKSVAGVKIGQVVKVKAAVYRLLGFPAIVYVTNVTTSLTRA
jgi:hypothetical protein